MKDIRVSPAAEARLAEIFDYSIDHWGLPRAEEYKDQLLERIKSVARNEPPQPRPCEVLMAGRRDATGLCYCREGRHYIILRVTTEIVEVVEFIHDNRDLERLIDNLAAKYD